jgi:hypothetical protein
VRVALSIAPTALLVRTEVALTTAGASSTKESIGMGILMLMWSASLINLAASARCASSCADMARISPLSVSKVRPRAASSATVLEAPMWDMHRQ